MSGMSRRRFVIASAVGVGGAASAMEIENYRRLGLDRAFLDVPMNTEVNDRSNLEIMDALNVPGDAQYHPCPEAHPGDDVPRGTMLRFPDWSGSEVFPGTVRDVWIHVPHGLAPGSAPAVMVFNDGLGYADPQGPVRAPLVLDSLMHAGDIPPTVGVFVMPGRPPGAAVQVPDPEALASRNMGGMQRSFEYDSVTDAYARFLTTELLPFAEAEVGHAFAKDPAQRTIVGISSGGICAFNAAWHDPQAFGRVLSHCGSFVNIRGGHNYPYLIKSTPRKPIRVFLTSGAGDANIIIGNWPLANKAVAAALEYAGYESRFVFGEGGHSLRHGGAVFADSLRWLAG